MSEFSAPPPPPGTARQTAAPGTARQTVTPFDHDNPEWTEEDFARARPIDDFPELAAAFPKSKGGRPRGSSKEQVSLRIDKDVLEWFKAAGPGWQSRINETLRKAVA